MKIGKGTKRNIDANKKLKEIYQAKGISRCELQFQDCMGTWGLGFAHKRKRWEYIKCPEKLAEFNETILACTMCHQKIENNKELTEYVFKKLRSDST